MEEMLLSEDYEMFNLGMSMYWESTSNPFATQLNVHPYNFRQWLHSNGYFYFSHPHYFYKRHHSPISHRFPNWVLHIFNLPQFPSGT